MSKRTIHIDRPDGQIPGLIEVNSYLAECFGVTVAAVIDTDDKDRFRWVGTQLLKAKIDGDSIISGDIIIGGKE
jgi:hypothetical protein